MDGTVVERMLPLRNPQETRALLERFCPQPRHFEQIAPGGEIAVSRTVFDNILS